MRASRVLTAPVSPVKDTLYFVRLGDVQIKSLVAGNQAELIDLSLPPPTLKGVIEFLYTGVPVSFQITNYNPYITYIATSATGTVAVVSNTVLYTPNLPIDSNRIDSFVVNGRTFQVSVLAETPMAPMVLYPPDGSEDIMANTVVTESSVFATNNPETTDSHATSDWEIATDPEFNNIVASTYNDSENLTTWDPNV